MSDYRKILYDQYVSKFKANDSQLGDDSCSSYFAWCEYKFLPLLKGLRSDTAFLELGCGPGYMLRFLKRCGFTQARGIDISREQVQIAISHNCHAEVADVFDYLDGRPDAFGAIIALDFIEHFYKDELMSLMPLLFRSLEAGGRLILQTPNGEGLFPRQVIYGDLTHLTVFTPGSLRQILEVAGFHELSFSETGPVPKDARGKLRVWLWRLIKAAANTARRIETGKSQAIWTENMICCCEKAGL